MLHLRAELSSAAALQKIFCLIPTSSQSCSCMQHREYHILSRTIKFDQINFLQDKGTSSQGSKKVLFCCESSKENEHPQVNDSSQESETTPPAANLSSAEDGRCLESNTRFSSSPSPTRSSGSPDSGYSTIELEPGSRALSLARLAVRVREGRLTAVRVGEGDEVVAALHLLARLLDGTWGEEEAKVCLIKP